MRFKQLSRSRVFSTDAAESRLFKDEARLQAHDLSGVSSEMLSG